RKFPLQSNFGYDLFAGRLPGGELGLLTTCNQGDFGMACFDADGWFLRAEARPVEGPVPGAWEGYGRERELIKRFLASEFEMDLDLIHVHEFRVDQFAYFSVCQWPVFFDDLFREPDNLSHWSGKRRQANELVHRWLTRGDFEIQLMGGNDYWAGPDGRIHSS